MSIPKEERLKRVEKLPEIAKRYLDGEDIKALSAQYGIPVRTLYRNFKAMGISRPRGKGVSPTEKAVREKEVEALREEGEKIATIAIGLGGVIARRYLPLIDHLLSTGKTLEMIAIDVMDWYEMKIPTEANIKELETEIESLRRKLAEAYIIASGNFKYMLRSKIVEKYAKHLLVARMHGLRVAIQPTLRALHNDLLQVEEDFKEATIK